MDPLPRPLAFFLLLFSGCANRHQQAVIDYLLDARNADHSVERLTSPDVRIMRKRTCRPYVAGHPLVNEAWIRLAKSKQPPVANRQQFFRAMAAQMRRHLVNYARRNRALKRGAGVYQTDFDDEVDAPANADAHEGEKDLEHLDRALEALGRDPPRAAQVVNLRFFGGRVD